MVREIEQDGASITLYEDPFSKRIRVDDCRGNETTAGRLIRENTPGWTEKLIVKARPIQVNHFLSNGFSSEALVKGYFSGEDMHFVTKYFSESRRQSRMTDEEDLMVKLIQGSVREAAPVDGRDAVPATTTDAPQLADLYRRTFAVYPTPMGDEQYIVKTMNEGTLYFLIRDAEGIASVASAEINRKYNNAEMTDCATELRAQGKGMMKRILSRLGHELNGQGITCLYTIARSASYGMNNVFYQLGYTYGGRMNNNCMIFSGMEDMNVWYKN